MKLRKSRELRVATPSDTYLAKNRQTMKKKSRRKNVFIDNIKIETQTIYAENGNINIYPCAFEENHNIVVNGERASQKGRMVTDDDGTSCFRPYAVDSGSRYNTLLRTAHGTVKETKGDYIFTLRFPKKLGVACIAAILDEEQAEQQDFFNELNETEE